MRVVALGLFALVAGCGGGKSAVELTITSNGVVHGVTALSVTVTNAGSTSPAVQFVLDGPIDISAAQPAHANLILPADRSGTITVSVEARADGALVATGTGAGTITPGQLSAVTVVLSGTSVGDMAMSSDASLLLDLGLQPDIATLPSSWSVVGSSSGLGGSVAGDNNNYVLEGSIGIPGPRTVSVGTTGNNKPLSIEPLLPGR